MQIKIHSQHLNLSDSQNEMIESKVGGLVHFADRLSDESTEIKVNFSYEQSRKSEDAYECELTIFAPMDTLRAHSRSKSLENALDEVIEKMKGQIENYKAKIHHK